MEFCDSPFAPPLNVRRRVRPPSPRRGRATHARRRGPMLGLRLTESLAQSVLVHPSGKDRVVDVHRIRWTLSITCAGRALSPKSYPTKIRQTRPVVVVRTPSS